MFQFICMLLFYSNHIINTMIVLSWLPFPLFITYTLFIGYNVSIQLHSKLYSKLIVNLLNIMFRNHVFTLVDNDVAELQNFQNENYKQLSIEESKNEAMLLEEIDQPCGILRVWYCIVEGLCTAITGTTAIYQRQSLELLLDILRTFPETPGHNYTFSFNTVIIIMIELQDLYSVVSALIDYCFLPYKPGHGKLYLHKILVIYPILNSYVEIRQI